jgi:nucleotide-binding universal stress UspA family protein
VEKFAEACRAAGVRHQVKLEVGEPFTRMIEEARYHDLMVFGLRSLFEFELVPDPQNALVRLVQEGVRPLIAVSKGYYPVKKVLIAYSGSMESAKAMKRFVQLRLWPDAKLRIINFNYDIDKAEQLVSDAADYCRAHGFDPEIACVNESPKKHLIPYSEEWGADLTVVGNSAKSLMLRRLFGETALHAIQTANRPLFLAQ